MMRLTSLGLVLMALPTQALAWEHTYSVWTPDQMPIEIHVGDVCEDSVVNEEHPAEYRGYDVDSYCVYSSLRGMEAWEAAACADFDWAYNGLVPNTGYSPGDQMYTITFDDPDGQIEEAGTLAVTFSLGAVNAFVLDGVQYRRFSFADIVFNNNVEFAGNANVVSTGRTDFDGVMVHEMGHSMGMAHSCEENEVCLDASLKEATMFWSVAGGDASRAELAQDDIEGFTALYGPFATFQCSHELSPGDSNTQAIGRICEEGEACDGPGFKLKCKVASDSFDELTRAEWDFGDGGTSTELEPSHEYTEPGNYTVRTTFFGEREGCGDWSYTYRRVGYVTACGAPDVAATAEPVAGLTYRFLNETDISVYGCIQDVLWEVYKDGSLVDELKAWEPEYSFEEPGEYRVVLNVGGIGGTAAAEFTLDAKRVRDQESGCSTTGGTGLGGFGILLALGGLVRRRRQ